MDAQRGMKLEELDFDLPEALIALHPQQRRADARLLVARPGCRAGAGGVDTAAAGADAAADATADCAVAHHRFSELAQFLTKGDLLVLNDTRVLPARLCLHKTTGGLVEGLFLHEENEKLAVCMLSAGRLRPGVKLVADGIPVLRLMEKRERGSWQIENLTSESWTELLHRIGSTPLPPYIRRLRGIADQALDSVEDRERYQTVWAAQDGSVAAPTASLHFDQAMLAKLEGKGVEIAHLTLHVGQGTFLPVETERVEDHPMHSEKFEVSASLAEKVDATKKRGGRIIAGGTTVCRALEGWALGHRGTTNLMILPGFEFQIVGGLITNFHTPQSTLLALVGAMAQTLGADDGLGLVKQVYAEAIAKKYRFFSYGDASLWI